MKLNGKERKTTGADEQTLSLDFLSICLLSYLSIALAYFSLPPPSLSLSLYLSLSYALSFSPLSVVLSFFPSLTLFHLFTSPTSFISPLPLQTSVVFSPAPLSHPFLLLSSISSPSQLSFIFQYINLQSFKVFRWDSNSFRVICCWFLHTSAKSVRNSTQSHFNCYSKCITFFFPYRRMTFPYTSAFNWHFFWFVAHTFHFSKNIIEKMEHEMR